MRDPAGLAARSPELAAIAHRIPAVRRAVERGRPHEAYRALLAARMLRRLGDLAANGDALLAHRRLFFRPLTGAPAMFTLNGFGTRLYGNSEYDVRDGTYVATLFAVALFLPVFPIGAYLVRDGSGGAFRRSWGFLAKVPLSTVAYLWQRTVALGLLLLLAVGIAKALYGYGHGSLHVANGLDRAVRVELGTVAAVDVPAGGTAEIGAPVGSHPIRVLEGTREIERASIEVPRTGPALVWNVLGAAPVYFDKVLYVASGQGADASSGNEPEVYCGTSLVPRAHVDYLLTEPPKQLSGPEQSKSLERSHLGVAPGGWQTCAGWLAGRGQTAKATQLAMRVLSADHATAAEIPAALEGLLRTAPLAEAESFAKDVLSRDDSIDAHRIYQSILLGNGLRARAQAEYDARLAARPNDGDAEYLSLRVRTIAEERRAIDAALARHPNHPYLRRVQVYVHYAARDFAQVLATSEALRQLDPAIWQKVLHPHVEALVALDRGQEALGLSRSIADDQSQPLAIRKEAEELAFRVAHRIGSPAPPPVSPDEDGSHSAYLKAVAGIDMSWQAIDALKDDHLREALRIAAAARSKPDSAIALARKADAASIGALPMSVRTLLLAESARRDEGRDILTKLGGGLSPQVLDAMAAYVNTGTQSDELVDLPLELQGALDLVRSRVVTISAAEKRDALSRAKRSDLLRGPVTVAIEGWPS
jgi:hypothetical protein